jgi:uncharacterized protein
MTAPQHRVIVERTWESELLESREDFIMSTAEEGHRLSATTLILHEGTRAQIDWMVALRPDWSTRSASIDIPALAASFEVEVTDPGRWTINGNYRPDLEGCIDIDLGWTPATNTVPIRRLAVATGMTRTILIAWLQWPKLLFVPAEQTYTKHSDDRWTYASGGFSADLLVDEQGVVIDYGEPPIWRAVP